MGSRGRIRERWGGRKGLAVSRRKMEMRDEDGSEGKEKGTYRQFSLETVQCKLEIFLPRIM